MFDGTTVEQNKKQQGRSVQSFCRITPQRRFSKVLSLRLALVHAIRLFYKAFQTTLVLHRCGFTFFFFFWPLNRNTGIVFPMTVKKGDRVLLPEFTPTMFKVGKDKYGLYSEQDILCTLHDE